MTCWRSLGFLYGLYSVPFVKIALDNSKDAVIPIVVSGINPILLSYTCTHKTCQDKAIVVVVFL